ncbi:hypothetical protein QQF64_003379 [Cirrhinus molitorella]|uniref:Secreted protein n=1 Tax=Cirrhinus molitorella TaxID=172907 RepID=A0ABR3ML63_9TELE
MLEFCIALLFLRLMASGVLTKDGSRAIRVYESSKTCPEKSMCQFFLMLDDEFSQLDLLMLVSLHSSHPDPAKSRM